MHNCVCYNFYSKVKILDFIKRMFGKEPIPDSAIIHSSKGNYTKNNRMIGGGHGQEAIDYMNNNNLEYNIVKTYSNGVRVGNVKRHKDSIKKMGTNQSWFPKNWSRKDIKKAGQIVAIGKKYPDVKIKHRKTNKVDVGIIRTNGKIATIFPLSEQKNKRKRK